MTIKDDIARREYQEYTNPSNASAFEGKQNKFRINLRQYPSDLGSQDLQHYVSFRINVRGRSSFDKGKRLYAVNRNPDSANLNEDQIARASSRASGIAVGALAFGLTKNFLEKVPKTGSVSTTTGKLGAAAAQTVGGAVAGLAAGYLTQEFIEGNQLLKPDVSYRISDAIALHMEAPPTVRYSMNYANKDLGTLAGLISGGVEDSIKDLASSGEASAALFTSLAKLPSAFGATDIQSLLGVASKTALNPFKEVVFESVDHRSFSFKYRFFPKSFDESAYIHEIIRLFKFHMHPEMSSNKLFFLYPSEFQISYHFGGGENGAFHKFAPCVLESMDVTYGGETFSSFKDGYPTEINMTLNFRELEILTKKMIDRGY